jgi:hypothetical protein
MGCEALECHSLARTRDTSVGAESVHRGLLLATPRLFFPRLLRAECLSPRLNLLLHAQPWQHLMMGNQVLWPRDRGNGSDFEWRELEWQSIGAAE